MYAVIKTGGKQYKVSEGETIKFETLPGNPGDKIEFKQVLMLSTPAGLTVGLPYIKDSKVTAEVIGHGRARKIRIVKFRRRKHHRKQMGHRQNFTEVKITGIQA